MRRARPMVVAIVRLPAAPLDRERLKANSLRGGR